MKKYFGIAFVVICAGVLCSQPSWREQVGRQPDGTFLLSNGWSLQPAGKQIPLDTLPMSVVPSKDGKFLLVLNGGYKPPSIIVLSAADMHEVSRVPLPDAWLGLAISPDGTHVYASGGSRATVYEFMLSSDGALQAGARAGGGPGGAAGVGRFHRRRGGLARRAQHPRGRYVSRFDRGDRRAIGACDAVNTRLGGVRIAFCSIPTANRFSFRAGPTGRSIFTTRQAGSNSGAFAWRRTRPTWF